MILAFSRKIKPQQFSEIGEKLGLKKTELEHIQHRTLSNRKDANIQMLSKWKASQTSGNEAIQTLKLVWKSVQAVPNVENLEDEGSSRELEPTPVEKTKPNEPCEPEDMEIIVTTACDDVPSVSPGKHSESPQDLDRHGGVPGTEELCSVALSVKSLSTACSLGKALRVNDDVIVGSIDLPSLSILHKIAGELVDSWQNGLKKEEQEDKFAKLLSEYNIPDVKAGREKISKAIVTKTDLVDLCHRLNVKPSGVLQIMSKFVTFPSHMIGRSTLRVLTEWVHQGGTRERLLEIAQAFRFNDAAVKIAEDMKCQPSYIPFLSHGIIDHKGGELTLDELGTAVSIPEGAIPKGMRSVVTLRVSTPDTLRLPVREGEVVITPVVESSLTQELLKPATVVLPHCTNHHERKDDYSVILYTRTGPGTFGRRNLTPSQISKDKITFCTRHLQVLALSSTDLQELQLRCVVFQPVFMTPAERPTLRVYLLHPYMNRIEDITRTEKSSSVPYCRVMKEFTFSIESEARDLNIVFDDGTKRKERTIPIKSILSGKCSPLNFELQFSPEEKGKKNGHIDILQGSAKRAEKEFIVYKEDEPDYAVEHTDSQGRLQYVSNILLEILADVIHTPKDVITFGYQLGLSYSSMKKHNDQTDVYLDSVSRSGFGKMLRDWRRQVRPSEQVDELHLALQDAGLGHAAEVILHELSSRRRFAKVKQVWESKK
ncbi:uncharacterized protein LOC105445423 [Strongylocentrotus purpuratus]|uniref:Netrin receptor UNC5 n=1 Tax=Strongylocentrotus purpuratus TaxID=7668 RepID=A0A7M7PDB9_STRPU|nr:uncharacterized protein LOC105445423 [Strongylocentrotus purpuratus]